MSGLENKRILLIGPKLFNYHNIIADAIRQKGATVHFYDERNNPSSIEKIVLRKVPFLMSSKIDSYYHKIAKKEQSFNPDFVLFISPEAVTRNSVFLLKNTFQKATFILYMWDSIENKNAKKVIDLFDRKLSFDPNDCEKYGMVLRPLFFTRENELSDIRQEFLYDVSFIGTVHSDRAKLLLDLKNYCDSNDIKYYFYLFIPGRLLYCLRMLFDPSLRKWDKKYIHITPIKKEIVESIHSSTRCGIDINHPKQTGLTMRTIEMLGLKRKLLTTNNNVRNYDFYRPQNQIVIDRKDVKISREMLVEEFQPVSEEILRRYSINYWVDEVFDRGE